ncbi:phosphatidylinositol polyphosphate 5-phosphatase type IV-like [Watersipora subatra]|uniref:phosphatidylinositol polyphosphate 5-phosphatase type IV-like n=1 Tax=Watersipora subatra TaxID=2589382 RepID=UPI00355B52D2
MSKADSMPDISESASSSRRNWSFIKDRLGGSGADDLYESGLKKSFSTSSMNTLASSGLHTVRISTARHKNFLVGQQNSTTSMLGAAELDRTFPGRHVSIFVGTWNMADRKELPKKIEDFLLPRSLEFVPDVLVISSQENSLDRKEWEILLQETIGPNHVIYHSAQHGTLHITVCMKRELIWFCSMAEDDTATVRAFKQFKTKGAVAISFMMFGTSFLFLCSHLTANEGSSAVRVKDYYTINHSIKLPRAVVENSLQQVDSEASKRFDFVFWAGDLNFRITKEKDQVLEMVKLERKAENPNYGQLLESDELTQAMLSQEVFKEFHEGDIRFPPTYKFDIDTDNYDELRTPSYTDRILYMSRKRHTVVCEKYSSVPEITHSDHKPVYGLYQVNLKPGRDTIPLSGGQFRRDIYVEAAKRRALRRVAAEIKPANRSPNLASSSICTIS